MRWDQRWWKSGKKLSDELTGQSSPEDIGHEIGDHNVELTERGHAQVEAVGRELGADFFSDALLYCSPYRRTRQTLDGLLRGAGLGPAQRPVVFEDPRLREVEHGYYDYEEQTWDRVVHGWFYYRFRGGESPADCFDRVSTFLETRGWSFWLREQRPASNAGALIPNDDREPRSRNAIAVRMSASLVPPPPRI